MRSLGLRKMAPNNRPKDGDIWRFFSDDLILHHLRCTPLKFNMTPENNGFQMGVSENSGNPQIIHF